MRRHLLRSRAGQALVEYAVILALVSIGLMAILVALRNGVGGAYEETGARLDAVACGMRRDAACPSPPPDDPSGGIPGTGQDGNAGHGGGNGRGNQGNGNGNGGGDGSNGGNYGNGGNGPGGGPAR